MKLQQTITCISIIRNRKKRGESRIKKILLIAAIVCTALTISSVTSAQTLPCTCNVVVNGDFSAGNTGFTCGPGMLYQAGAGSEGHECVGSKLSDETPGWPAGWDNTQGTSAGKFLSIDGALTNNVDVWRTTIKVPCPVSYPATFTFSFYAKNAHPAGSAHQDGNLVVAMIVNGTPVTGGTNTIISTSWTRYFVTYTAINASALPTSLALRQTTGGMFRDFGVDDISLLYCPTPVLECHCPPTWLSNDFTGVGTANVLGGLTNNTPTGCKKKMCDVTCAPTPASTIPIGTWGFLWGNEIWAYGTTCNGGAAICHSVPCSSCIPYKP